MKGKYIYEHYFFNGTYSGVDNHSFILNNTEIIQFGEAKLNTSIEVLTFDEFALINALFNKHLEFNSFTHKQWSIMFSLKDNQVLSLNCENLKKNNVIIIPPYTHISSIFLGNISQIYRIAINKKSIERITNGKFNLLNRQIKMMNISNIEQIRKDMTSIFKYANLLKKMDNSDETRKEIETRSEDMLHVAMKILIDSQEHRSKLSNQDLFHAISFIRYLRDEDFDMNKIARQTGIKDRTLRYKFLNSLNVSPKRFHMSLRLHEVMKALKKGDNKTIISDIANIWGFWHMGQFAKDYKQFYGELPSETLKKRDTVSSKYIRL